MIFGVSVMALPLKVKRKTPDGVRFYTQCWHETQAQGSKRCQGFAQAAAPWTVQKVYRRSQ
jgi:hypothetical protein